MDTLIPHIGYLSFNNIRRIRLSHRNNLHLYDEIVAQTHATGTKRNPPRIVELARRLEPQGWIYDVPRSSLLNGEKQRSRTSLVSYASSGIFQLQGASKWRIRCPGFARIAGTGDPLTGYKKIEVGWVADHTVTSSFQLSLRIKDPQDVIKKLWRNTT